MSVSICFTPSSSYRFTCETDGKTVEGRVINHRGEFFCEKHGREKCGKDGTEVKDILSSGQLTHKQRKIKMATEKKLDKAAEILGKATDPKGVLDIASKYPLNPKTIANLRAQVKDGSANMGRVKMTCLNMLRHHLAKEEIRDEIKAGTSKKGKGGKAKPVRVEQSAMDLPDPVDPTPEVAAKPKRVKRS